MIANLLKPSNATNSDKDNFFYFRNQATLSKFEKRVLESKLFHPYVVHKLDKKLEALYTAVNLSDELGYDRQHQGLDMIARDLIDTLVLRSTDSVVGNFIPVTDEIIKSSQQDYILARSLNKEFELGLCEKDLAKGYIEVIRCALVTSYVNRNLPLQMKMVQNNLASCTSNLN
jgi:hypothetical protein